MQSPRFRVNRQVFLLLGVVLAALVLPVAAILVALLPRGGGGAKESVAAVAAAAEPAGLRERLEQLAGERLAPGTLDGATAEWRIMAPEPARAARHVAEFAKELGGSCEVTGLHRVVVSLPPQESAEFLRRVSLLTGAKAPTLAGPGPLALEFFSQEEAATSGP